MTNSPFSGIHAALAESMPESFEVPTDFQERHGTWEFTAVQRDDLIRYWSLSLTPTLGFPFDRVSVDCSVGAESGERYAQFSVFMGELSMPWVQEYPDEYPQPSAVDFFVYLVQSGLGLLERLTTSDLNRRYETPYDSSRRD